jgi:ADP-ribosyl-[dinitrogen reductase] hydrolase
MESDGGGAKIREQRAMGCLLGLACGDALGRPLEFKSASTIAAEHGRVTEMLGNGTHRQPAGTITDDTEMALCIAESLVECGEFNPEDIADRFVAWYDSGPFDIGGMTRQAIQNLKRGHHWTMAGHEVWKASPEGRNAGNGSVMRCAPLALAYPEPAEKLIRVSRDSSRITHADPRCVAGCAVLNLTIAALLQGETDPLATALEYVDSDERPELTAALEPIVTGDDPETLPTSGYVIHTLQTALFDALTADSTEEAIVTAVNRGGDTDTIGAIAGAVAGARFGVDDLPNRWLAALDEREHLEQLAPKLLTVGEW